jgi:hypothetical protein
MTISSVSNTTAAAATTSPQRPDPMADVAKLLNMSSSDLRDALKSGSSLSDVAAKQGVSRDDLLKQIETDLKNRPAGPGDTSAAAATSGAPDIAAVAAKIADTKGLPHHHGHHHGGSNSSSIAPTTTSASAVSAQLDADGGVSVLL